MNLRSMIFYKQRLLYNEIHKRFSFLFFFNYNFSPMRKLEEIRIIRLLIFAISENADKNSYVIDHIGKNISERGGRGR